MKKPIILTALFSVLILCVSQAQYILTMHFDEMDPYLGKTVEVRVVETSTGDEVGRKTISTLDTAAFSIQLYVLLEHRDYTIDIYSDFNESGFYEPPPIDHAWRRTITDATQDVDIDFSPDKNYSNSEFPNAFPFSSYEAVWGGKWMNLTFGSTDSIMAGFNLSCDSVAGFFITKGVFGNPNTVTFDFEDARPSGEGNDTIRFSPGDPWTGEVTIVEERLEGNISSSGASLVFTGTVGMQQIMALYIVIFGGDTIANGYYYVKELEVLSSSPKLTININAFSPTCFGLDNGAAFAYPGGGAGGYHFQWSTGSNGSSIVGIGAGDYSLTVTDSLGCAEESSFSIDEPEQMVTTWFTYQVSCNGLCDGFIDLIMIGGTPPYTYSWDNGLTTADAFNLCAGIIGVTVTDNLGCVVSAPITVFEPDPLIVEVETTDIACFGSCSGTVIHTISGGIPPYSFMDQTDLCAGSYETFVLDANGCSVATPVTIIAPDSLGLDIVIQHATNNQSDGAIYLDAYGGVPPYQYALNSGPFQALSEFTDLPEGFFTVTLMDANGCIFESEVYIFGFVGTEELQANYRFYPNPATTWINLEADLPVFIELMNMQGHVIMYSKKSETHLMMIENIVRGIYLMRISDGVGVDYQKVIIQ